MMNQHDIENLVSMELEEIIPENFHGINQTNITECLIKPVKKKFFNSIENNIEEHWVVFDEDKNDNRRGYLIFYSENDNSFGIGTKTNLKGIEQAGSFVGIYGSFFDTIKSM
jgi:hypothetical protein